MHAMVNCDSKDSASVDEDINIESKELKYNCERALSTEDPTKDLVTAPTYRL